MNTKLKKLKIIIIIKVAYFRHRNYLKYPIIFLTRWGNCELESKIHSSVTSTFQMKIFGLYFIIVILNVLIQFIHVSIHPSTYPPTIHPSIHPSIHPFFRKYLLEHLLCASLLPETWEFTIVVLNLHGAFILLPSTAYYWYITLSFCFCH